MDQPADNALYLRKWAADIREMNGKSVDADRLDAIAWEIEQLRKGEAEREDCAKLIEGMKMDAILLAAGEMSAQERRTVRALQKWFAHKIRTRTD